MILYPDVLNLAWEGLIYKWQDRADELKMQTGHFNHGLLHAYQQVIRSVDENAFLEYPVELEVQTQELLSMCNRESAPGVSEYGMGYSEGMKQCAFDVKKMLSETIG